MEKRKHENILRMGINPVHPVLSYPIVTGRPHRSGLALAEGLTGVFVPPVVRCFHVVSLLTWS